MSKNNRNKIKGILVYTTGDFPYGMAPENLVRQMVLGIRANNIQTKVIRLRGKTYQHYNDTGVDVSNFMFNNKTKNEFTKLVELILLLLFAPFSIIYHHFRNHFNVIILYGVEYFYQIFDFWWITRLTGIKLIRITTDYYRESTVKPVWWKKPKLWFYNFQFKHFDKHVDGIVCLSSYMANFAKENGVSPLKVTIIPHFIDVKGFCSQSLPCENRDIFRVGFCGSPCESNGIFDLINAFKIVNKKRAKTELFIIGEPFPIDAERINKQTEEIRSTIKITGVLSKKDVPAALLSCNVLVNPRKSGRFAEAGFPTKLGEYLSTSLPVISSKVGDIRNYFNNNELILVNPDNPVELADAIIWSIDNKESAMEIGKNGYEWALKYLDHLNNARKLISFIEKEFNQRG